MKELKDTVEDMNSDNYKNRFKAEYEQTKIRYVKLASFITRIKDAKEVNSDYEMKRRGVVFEEPKHDYQLSLLERQLNAMNEYLHILEIRATIENIPLSDR